MSTINNKSYQDPRNINLKGGVTGLGLIRWAPHPTGSAGLWSANPFSSDDYGLYLNAAGSLVFSSVGATTILGAAGAAGAVPSLETLFGADPTLTVTGTTFTVNDAGTGANDVLTASSTAAGSGNIIQITNGGSGKDIMGTSDSWYVGKTGAAYLLSLDTPTITSAANLAIGAAGAGVLTLGINSNTITIAKAATFSSTVTVTDGLVTLISTSNIAPSTLITNNTVTTYGAAAASAGVVVIRSTSLTTGSLLRLQLTEDNLTTGNYLDCYDVSGSALVFEIGENGVITQGGVAGSTVNTITAGDMVMSDGSIAITDADNAATLSVTNDTATTNSVLVFAGSGVFSGTTTTSFMTLTPSGLTTGTALYIAAAGATTSVGVVDVIGAVLTSGSLVRLTTNTAAFTTGGKALEITLVAAVAGNGVTVTTTGAYTGTGLAILTAGAMTTGIGLSVVSTTGLTTGSLIRATSSTAGAIATNGAIFFNATGAHTSTSNVGFVNIKDVTLTGTVFSVTAASLTTGIGIYMPTAEAGLTGAGRYISLGGVFSVAKFGATVIAGSALGTAALTLTAGDIVVTAGDIILTAGGITSALPTGRGIGYATGAGGTVTQLTNRSTGVTLNTLCGKIQTDTTSLAAGASAEFTFTNSTIAIGDVVVVSQRSGSSSAAGVAGTLIVEVVTVAAGSCIISLNNNSSTTAETGAVIINFAVIKSVTA